MTLTIHPSLRLAVLLSGLLTLAACATTPAPQAAVKAPHVHGPAPVQKTSLAAAEAAYKRDSADPDVAFDYAQALRISGRLQRAAIVLSPFVQDPGQQDADIFAEYGAIQIAMTNYPDAGDNARKAIALDAGNGQAYYVLGMSLDAQSHPAEAETAFRQALAHWDGNPSPVLNNLGLNLAAQGYIDEAVNTMRKASSLDPGNAGIKRNLRIVLALQAQTPPDQRSPAGRNPAGRNFADKPRS